MAVPLGFGIGDCIAVSKLIYQVSQELRNSGHASPDYQETIVILEFLDTALNRIFELVPGMQEQAKLDFVRAIAMSCKRLLQEFLDKVMRFEPELGSYASGSSQKLIYRRLQWNMKYGKEMAMLRSKLSTHVDTMNLSLSLQTADTVKSIHQGQIKQTTLMSDKFKTLQDLLAQIATSQSQAEATKQSQTSILNQIRDGNNASDAKISDLLRDTNTLLCNQSSISLRLDDTNHSLYGVNQKLADIRITAQNLNDKADRSLGVFTDITNMLSQGALKIQDLLVKLNELRTIMIHFSSTMLQVTTRLLETFCQLRTILLRLEHFLPLQIYLPIVRFRDPFGNQMALPYELSRRWRTFKGMLAVTFIDKQGAWRIERGLYSISHKRLGIALNPIYWDNAVRENDELTMSVIIPEHVSETSCCPWKSCGASLQAASESSDGINCPVCYRWIVKPLAQVSEITTKVQTVAKNVKFAGAIISVASDDSQQIVSLGGQELCLNSNTTSHGKSNMIREDIDLYRSIRVSVDGLDACGLLKVGARFHGLQRSGQRQIYNITIVILAIVIPIGYISGFMTSSAPTDAYPPMTTYFEGEIIDGKNHKFKTPETHPWGGTAKTDFTQWNRVPPFKQFASDFRRKPNFPKDIRFLEKTGSEHVFMRWKEKRLSDSRIREVPGADFDGFYYICCDQKQGKIDGVYYNAKKKRYHILELTAEYYPDGDDRTTA